MSDNSNDPQPEITLEELKYPRVSISRVDGKAYFFFGKTPRAQLQIDINGPTFEAMNNKVVSLRNAVPNATFHFRA